MRSYTHSGFLGRVSPLPTYRKADHHAHHCICSIPSEAVDIDFVNDPCAEDLIYGSELKEGMVVLIESTVTRESAARLESKSPNERRRALESARWCRIEKLRRNHHNGGMVHFIGVYHDGTKMERSYNESYAWYVKKSTM